jgi:hypothetical protein
MQTYSSLADLHTEDSTIDTYVEPVQTPVSSSTPTFETASAVDLPWAAAEPEVAGRQRRVYNSFKNTL